MSCSLRLAVLAAAPLATALLVAHAARAAPPPGQSALLNGMHDMEALSWMKGATSGCDKGWITDLRYIGTGGTPGAACHTAATTAGVSVIQRLDVSGSESIPKSTSQAAGYAAAFAAYVAQCSNLHVWIVGNEPNFTFNKSDPDCSTAAYAAAYVAVHKQVHAVAGHAADLVLVAPNSPYSPGCLHSLRSIIDAIKAQGVTPDGFALHAYTRAGTGSTLNAGYVSSTATQSDTTVDECAGGATWSDTWHSHFRIYKDYIKVIESRGLAGKPVFITESGNACTATKGNACYPDADVGYFQALYGEAAAHNAAAGTKTKIRAITPYRWTINDDGTGRDFAIGKRPKLLAELKQAFAKKHAWTKVGCSPTPTSCSDDADCSGKAICDLGSGACKATTACGSGGSCPAGQLCRTPTGDCVPSVRGAAGLTVSPSAPAPGSKVVLDASSATGYTNVGLKLEGPLPAGVRSTKLLKIEKIGGLHHWKYEATVGATGTYRATFSADPGASTVYAIAYFHVGKVTAPTPDGGPLGDGAVFTADLAGQGQDLAPSASEGGANQGSGMTGGCSCRLASAHPAVSLPLLLSLLLLLLLRPRR